jgi:hypothetical protein|tara:strand:- start:27 stop:617 length:591 start_codon:yes stop_codon:yes gene_type:complete
MDSFIYQKKLLSADECKSIITFFNSNKKLHYSGITATGVNPNAKVSTDFPGFFKDSDGKYENEVSELIASKLKIAVEEYKQKYPELDDIHSWSLLNGFNIQRYYPTEGYFAAHAENDGENATKNRVLVWMIYLNTLNFGGGTKFPYYKKTIKAEQGKVVLWPAYWTHLHHGVVHNFKTKYIATGWYSFDEINKDAL